MQVKLMPLTKAQIEECVEGQEPVYTVDLPMGFGREYYDDGDGFAIIVCSRDGNIFLVGYTLYQTRNGQPHGVLIEDIKAIERLFTIQTHVKLDLDMFVALYGIEELQYYQDWIDEQNKVELSPIWEDAINEAIRREQ